jgi:energy-converting hydrogenase B subunit D
MPGLTLELLLDIILAAALIGLGWIVLTSRDLFRGVVLFIVFGLLMSLVWLRLGAPDIALAEAAIGTGLTAALLLEAVRQIENPREEDTEDQGMDREEEAPHAG